MDIVTLALAKKFAAKVASGFSHVEVDGLNIIFTLNDGSQVTLTVPEPVSDISITDMNIDNDGNLICTMSNGKTLNAGRIKFNPKGIYDNSIQYSLFDLINYNGSSYIAKDNTIGNLPTNSQYWQLIAEKGETGEVSQTQFDDLQEQVKDKENNQLTGTAEGTEIDLTDSADSRVKEMKAPQGNSTQETTEGYNIIDTSNYTTETKNGVTVTRNNDGSLKLSGTASIATAFAYYFDEIIVTGNYLEEIIVDGTITGNLTHNFRTATTKVTTDLILESNTTKTKQFTLENQTINNGFLYFPSNCTVNCTIYPMLIQGTTSKPYEKYTNGASPNPNYEQPIKSAGDNGFINDKVVNENLLEITENSMLVHCSYVSGVNTNEYKLLCTASDMYINDIQNIGTAYNKARNGNLIPCAYGDTIYFDIGNSLFAKNYFNEYDENFISLGNYNKSMSSGTYTPTNSNCKYVTLRFGYGANAQAGTTYTLAPIISKIPISSYIPHKNQTFSIPTQQPMRSIGTTRDCFFKNTQDSEYYDSNLEENKWYERHPIFRYILQSSNITAFNTTYNRFDYLDLTSSELQSSSEGLSNVATILITGSVNKTNTNKMTIRSHTGGGFYVYGWLDGITSKQEAETYLDNHNIYIDALLVTPTNLPCTEAQTEALEAYMKARTYKNVTHIYTEDEVPAYIELEYIKDLEQVIDNTLPASKIITLTQDEYDAIQTKDDDTYYFITESIENNNMGEE